MTALRHASGRYIAICDSDDISDPERFAKQVSFLDSHPEIDVVGSQVKYFWGDQLPRPRFMFPDTEESIEKRFSQNKAAMAHQSCMIRRKCFDDLGPYREDFRRVEDLELFLRFRESCRFHTIPEFLLLYRHEVRGIPLTKWMDNERYHRYAVYLGQKLAGDKGDMMTFERFSRRWSVRIKLYTVDMLRFVRFNVWSYIHPKQSLA